MTILKKQWRGVVVSKAGDMTVVVEVRTETRHPLYKKKVKHSKRYMVHDRNNTAEVGDEVTIKESRPISKRKRWVLVEQGEDNNKRPVAKKKESKEKD